MDEEINPDHPVTAAMRGQWHKILGYMMHKMNVKDFTITVDDIQEVGNDLCVMVHEKRNELHVSLITRQEAEQMMKTGVH